MFSSRAGNIPVCEKIVCIIPDSMYLDSALPRSVRTSCFSAIGACPLWWVLWYGPHWILISCIRASVQSPPTLIRLGHLTSFGQQHIRTCSASRGLKSLVHWALALGMLPYDKAQTVFLESHELWFTASTKCHECEWSCLRTFSPAESLGTPDETYRRGTQLTPAQSADP